MTTSNKLLKKIFASRVTSILLLGTPCFVFLILAAVLYLPILDEVSDENLPYALVGVILAMLVAGLYFIREQSNVFRSVVTWTGVYLSFSFGLSLPPFNLTDQHEEAIASAQLKTREASLLSTQLTDGEIGWDELGKKIAEHNSNQLTYLGCFIESTLSLIHI